MNHHGAPTAAPDRDLASAPHSVQRAFVAAAVRRRPRSRSDLTMRLNLSSSAVSRLVQSMIADEWLLETGSESVAIGRPRTILALNPMAGHIVSVLLGPGRLHARIVDARGKALVDESHDLTLPMSSAQIIRALDIILKSAGLHSPTLAIGVSAPGVVDADGAVIEAPDLGWTTRVNLGDDLRQHYGVRVTVDNDVNLMMLAESVNGIAVGVPDAVFLYHGARGIGLGIMSGGVILGGASGASGEIGLMPLDLLDPAPRPRLLEDAFSLDAISAQLTALGIEPTNEPMEMLARAAAQGNDSGVLDQLILVVARAIGAASLFLNPSLVVIGGGLRAVLHGRTAELASRLTGWVPAPPDIKVSELGEEDLLLAVQTRCWDSLVASGL